MPDRPPHPEPHNHGPSGPEPASAGDPGAGQRVHRTDGQDQPRYRSLRELSYGGRPGPDRPPASQTWQNQRTAGSAPGAVLSDESGPASPPTVWPEAAPRPRPGRRLLIATTSLVAVVALLVGGYYAYQRYAPRFGWGYTPGGTAAINGVAFAVVDAECGLSEAPLTGARPSKAQFCTVDLNAENQVDSNRYLVLSLFSVNLNSGLQADPSSTAMQTLSVKLAPGESRDLRLVYDVWDGVQMTELQVQIGYETELIPLV